MDSVTYSCTIYAIPPCTYHVAGLRGNRVLLTTNGPWNNLCDLMSEENTVLWNQIVEAVNERLEDPCQSLHRSEGGIEWQSEKYQIRGTIETAECAHVGKNCWVPLAGFHTRDTRAPIPATHMRAFVHAINTLGYTIVQCKITGSSKCAKELQKEIGVRYLKSRPLEWFERVMRPSGHFMTDVQATHGRGQQWRCKFRVDF
jgi:hypothetical protein